MVKAQEITHVNNISGSAFIIGDISENQARQQALNAAKIKALQDAGIQEHIGSYEALYTSQVNNDFNQFFSSDAYMEIQGAVKNIEILSERKVIDPSTGNVEYQVLLNAEVVRYAQKSDPAFDAVIAGIKPVYGNGENLQFSVESSQNAYLHIFNITDKASYLLVPNQFEPDNLLIGRKIQHFPLARIDYTLETEKKDFEVNRLVFVLTKQPVKYLRINTQKYDQVVENEQIFNWVYSITPDQRKIIYQSFIIRK